MTEHVSNDEQIHIPHNIINEGSRLLWLHRQGDITAFATLDNLYSEELRRYARSLINDQQQSEDIVQEVWLSVYRAENFDFSKSLKPYLYQSIRNRCIDYFRRHTNEKIMSDLADADGNTPEISAPAEQDASEINEKCRQTLTKLSKRVQEVLRLRFLEEKTTAEVAAILNISIATVKTHIQDARAKLQGPIKTQAGRRNQLIANLEQHGDKLSKEDRTILLLFSEGIKLQEIADRLNKPIKTMKWLKRKADTHLREIINGRKPQPSQTT